MEAKHSIDTNNGGQERLNNWQVVVEGLKKETQERVVWTTSNVWSGDSDAIKWLKDLLEKSQKSSQAHQASTSQQKNTVSLDIIDLSTIIDIYAEMQAVDEYDDMMKKSWEWWLFKKIGWFFKKSFYRMWRDAWIESKKRQNIKQLQEWLKNWTYTHQALEEHVKAWIKWIDEKSYLKHEELARDIDLPENIQKVIDEWLAIVPSDKTWRSKKIQELKQLLEEVYIRTWLTTDLSQLESSLLKIEKAKIEWELKTIEAKMNVLDIGRIEYWYWNRSKSFVVDVLSKIDKSSLPKWIKWFASHPNTAAVLSALWVRGLVSVAAGWAALWFAGGLLVPVAVWSLVWWILAKWRAGREIKDRNAQVDRRWSLWLMTWTEATDWKSVENLGKPNAYQHSVSDLYNRVFAALNSENKEIRNEALLAWASYLVKHKVGREKELNMLQYDNEKSVSSQHVEMISILNKVFPWFVANFNKWIFFDANNNSEEAKIVRDLYSHINALANDTISKRNKNEKSYAVKQWAIFWLAAFWVWSTIWVVSSYISDILSPPSSVWSITNQSGSWYTSVNYLQDTSSKVDLSNVDFTNGDIVVPASNNIISINHYPDNLQDYAHVKRGFWFDNKTPAPKFDYTELTIHTDKSWGWNVSNLLWKSPFTHWHILSHVSPSDFTSWNIQAVITPKVWWPSFVLPIDGKWNIQIPASMQEAFNKKSFAFLEVWKVSINWSEINLSPIATVKWSWNMVFDKIVEHVPWFDGPVRPITPIPNPPPIITDPVIPPYDAGSDTTWFGIPFWWNRYHHLNGTDRKVSQPKHKKDENVIKDNKDNKIPEEKLDETKEDKVVEGKFFADDKNVQDNSNTVWKEEISRLKMLEDFNKKRKLLPYSPSSSNDINELIDSRIVDLQDNLKKVRTIIVWIYKELADRTIYHSINVNAEGQELVRLLKYYEDAEREFKKELDSLLWNWKISYWNENRISNSKKFSQNYDDFWYDEIETSIVENKVEIYKDTSTAEEAYIKLYWDKEVLWLLSSQMLTMDSECKISINLPAYKEWENIYKALFEYSVKQLNKDWTPLNPSSYEINVLLNRPNNTVWFDEATEREILRFKKDYPQVRVNLIKHTFDFTWKPKMWAIYKTLADLSLYRKNLRDKSQNRMLIIRNGWADAMEKNKFFLSHIFQQFEQDTNIAVYKSESRYSKEVLEKLPLLHFMYTLNSWINRLYTRWKSNIWSWSYRSDIYAFSGWFNWELEIWEDIDLASRMRQTVKKMWKTIKKDLVKNAIDNPRRPIMSLALWIWLTNQYNNYNSEENQRLLQEISKMDITQIAELNNMIFSKENLERNLTQLYQYYLTKVRRYSTSIKNLKKEWASEIELTDKTYEITNWLFSRMFTLMWIGNCYNLVRRTTWKRFPSDARVEITNIDYITNIMNTRNFDSYNIFK
jgi:hypothetical protein